MLRVSLQGPAELPLVSKVTAPPVEEVIFGGG